MLEISTIARNIIEKKASCQQKPTTFLKYPKKPRRESFVSVQLRYPRPDGSFMDSPEEFIRDRFNQSHVDILNYLLFLAGKFKVVGCSQAHIARATGFGKRTVIKVLADLHEWRLIYKGYRHMRTCFYNISPYFKSPTAKSRLGSFFTSLRIVVFLSLYSLLSQAAPTASTPTCTLNKYVSYIRKKNYYKKYRPTDNLMAIERHKVYGENPISMAIQDITDELGLTKWGQIRLSAFPDEVILYVTQRYRLERKSRILNPFGWFKTVCIEHCAENNITPDWRFIYLLAEAYQMPTNAPNTYPQSYVHAKQLAKLAQEHQENSYKSDSLGEKIWVGKQAKASSPKRLYPVYEPKPIPQEDPDEAKKNIAEWLEDPQTQQFARLIGKNMFDKFVENRLTPLTKKGEV